MSLYSGPKYKSDIISANSYAELSTHQGEPGSIGYVTDKDNLSNEKSHGPDLYVYDDTRSSWFPMRNRLGPGLEDSNVYREINLVPDKTEGIIVPHLPDGSAQPAVAEFSEPGVNIYANDGKLLGSKSVVTVDCPPVCNRAIVFAAYRVGVQPVSRNNPSLYPPIEIHHPDIPFRSSRSVEKINRPVGVSVARAGWQLHPSGSRGWYVPNAISSNRIGAQFDNVISFDANQLGNDEYSQINWGVKIEDITIDKGGSNQLGFEGRLYVQAAMNVRIRYDTIRIALFPYEEEN